jgi:hypothetical protein
MRPAFTKDPLFKKGLRIHKALLGAQYIEGRLDQADEMKEVYFELDASARPKASGRRAARRR